MSCDSFLLDERALAIKSIFTGDYRSEIFSTHGIYYSKLTPKKLLNKACVNYLSTKKGRMQAATILLGYSRKPPFIISPNEFGVFPTASPDNPDCVWIFGHRFEVKEVTKNESIVTFVNGTAIKVKASKNIIDNQNRRLHTLLSMSSVMDREKRLYLDAKPSKVD
jgi:competence protein ComK